MLASQYKAGSAEERQAPMIKHAEEEVTTSRCASRCGAVEA
jgi:hypothetical protein